jgi:ubiquinone/menaquinone biosynthesis C-methylase UbiE
MGQQVEQQTYESGTYAYEEVEAVALPPPPTFQEFSNFWAIGIVPIILAWFAYKSLKLKVQARNRVKQENIRQKIHNGEMDEIDWDEAGDETIMSFVGDKLKRKK